MALSSCFGFREKNAAALGLFLTRKKATITSTTAAPIEPTMAAVTLTTEPGSFSSSGANAAMSFDFEFAKLFTAVLMKGSA